MLWGTGKMFYGNQVVLRGASGRDYAYAVAPVFCAWQAVPANYGFGYLAPGIGGGWTLLYLGQAEDMSKRMPGHEQLLEAVGRGATHVLNHVNWGGVDARRAEERDRIACHNPPLNVQHRTDHLADLLGIGGPFGSPSGFGSLASVLDPKRRY
jgi:hypothetical protein